MLVGDTGAIAVSGAHAVVLDLLLVVAIFQPELLPVLVGAFGETYLPFQLSEIAFSQVSLGATIALDIDAGQTAIANGRLTVGQDTTVSLLTYYAGVFDPEPHTDTLINAAQLSYDVKRVQNRIPNDRIVVYDGSGLRVILFPWSDKRPDDIPIPLIDSVLR